LLVAGRQDRRGSPVPDAQGEPSSERSPNQASRKHHSAPFLEAIPPNAVVFTASLPPALLAIENQMSDNRISDLRDLQNSITLAQLPAVASLLTRYRLFRLQFRFLSTKDDV